jgi:hypothetical protein
MTLVLYLMACGLPPPEPIHDHPMSHPAWLGGERPAPLPPHLALDAVVGGEASHFVLSGGEPGERVFVAGSMNGLGDGPCVDALGGACLQIADRAKLLRTVTLDDSGVATFELVMPAGLAPGTEMAFQAAIARGLDGAESVLVPPVVGVAQDRVRGLDELSEGDLVVTEVMQNPAAVPDADGEWFEITNLTGSAVDLQGLEVRDLHTDGFVVSDSLVVGPSSPITLGAQRDRALNGGAWVTWAWPDFTLANGDDEIVLAYEDTFFDVLAWDGGPGFPRPEGASMALSLSATDALANDLGENWCVGESLLPGGDAGGPGRPNAECAAAACEATPELGIHTPLVGRADVGWSSAAVHPCTGDMGVVWLEGDPGAEDVWFQVFIADGSPRGEPHLVSHPDSVATGPRVVWAADRYALAWTDQRHDRSCYSHCVVEIYYAARDEMGGPLVEEVRVTHKPDLAADVRIAANPDGHIGLIWVDDRAGREIYAALLTSDGEVVAETQVNEATADPSEANYPSLLWDEGAWLAVYVDRRAADVVYVRTLTDDGALGDEVTMRTGNRPRLVKTDDTYAFLVTNPSPELWFVDGSFSILDTAPVLSGSFDGSWGIGWDGALFWVGDNSRPDGYYLNGYDREGVLQAQVNVDPLPDYPWAQDVELTSMGDTLVLGYFEARSIRATRVVVVQP